jgi:hypothetical protein
MLWLWKSAVERGKGWEKVKSHTPGLGVGIRIRSGFSVAEEDRRSKGSMKRLMGKYPGLDLSIYFISLLIHCFIFLCLVWFVVEWVSLSLFLRTGLDLESRLMALVNMLGGSWGQMTSLRLTLEPRNPFLMSGQAFGREKVQLNLQWNGRGKFGSLIYYGMVGSSFLLLIFPARRMGGRQIWLPIDPGLSPCF